MSSSIFPAATPQLRLRFLWMAIGYGLVFTVVYLSVTTAPVTIDMGLAYQDKLFHALAYFSLMAWFVQIYHDRFRRNMIALVFVFMGVAMEYVQGLGPVRMFEYADMFANTAGVLLGLLLSLTRARNMLVWIEARLF